MSDFTTSRTNGRVLDPLKRTNHVLGLVMGEDEFQDDIHHLRERDHRAVRALHGYGTVSGLSVLADNGNGELEVRPGLAVDPVGRLICVPSAQCATINEWLNVSANRTRVEEEFGPFGAGATTITLYVVLCYDECLTDDVPVPAAECLSAEESTVASRIAESFSLRLELAKPEPVGELSEPEDESLTDSLGEPAVTLSEFVEQVWQTLASFPDDLSGESLPAFDAVRDQILEWVTRRRPELAQGLPCLRVRGEPCVFIARVELDVELQQTVDGDQLTMDGSPLVFDDDRPVLLSTRFLQELLLQVADRELSLDDLTDVDAAAPGDSEVLTFQAGRWQSVPPAAAGGGAPSGPASGDLAGSYPDPSVAGLRGRPMAGPFADGQALLFSGAPASGDWRAGPVLKPNDPANGDLGGTYPDPQVDGIVGFPIQGPGPNDGDVLVFSAGAWNLEQPTPPPAAAAVPLETLLPFATIVQLADVDFPNSYAIWFHIDAQDNNWEVLPDTPTDVLDSGALEVFSETGSGTFLNNFVVSQVVRQNRRNVFVATVDSNAPLLRFRFQLDAIDVRANDGTELTLAEYAWRLDPITNFVGQELASNTVTKFVRNASSRTWIGSGVRAVIDPSTF